MGLIVNRIKDFQREKPKYGMKAQKLVPLPKLSRVRSGQLSDKKLEWIPAGILLFSAFEF